MGSQQATSYCLNKLYKEKTGNKLNKQEATMPNPKTGETEQEFVSRCIPIVIKEGLDQKQSAGKCYGIYRNAKKSEMFKSLRKMIDVLKVKCERRSIK